MTRTCGVPHLCLLFLQRVGPLGHSSLKVRVDEVRVGRPQGVNGIDGGAQPVSRRVTARFGLGRVKL